MDAPNFSLPPALQASTHASHWLHPAESQLSRILENTASLGYEDEPRMNKE